MTVTIKDIAGKMGISIGTVSYALNNKGRVSDELREKILKEASKMGYIPNRNARNLAKKVKGRIGLFIPDVDYLRSSAFFNNLIAGIISIVDHTDNDLLLALTKGDFENLLDGAMDVDGAIVLHPRSDSVYYNLLNKSHTPFLIIGRPAEQFENHITYVDVDNAAIAYNVTKMLLGKGHRTIAAVLGNKDYTIAIDHLAGYELALKEMDIAFDDNLILNKDFVIHSSMDEVEALITRSGGITAIITASDTQAISVVNQLKRMKISIPADLSVTCMGGSYLTMYYTPSISGIISPSYEIGKVAANKIIDLINRKTIRPTHSIVDYSFFEGTSVNTI